MSTLDNGRIDHFRPGVVAVVLAVLLAVLVSESSSATPDHNDVPEKSAESVAKTIRLVSVGWDGDPANGGSWSPDISANGRTVAYYSAATNLDRDFRSGTNGKEHVFVARIFSDGSQFSELVSRTTTEQGNAYSRDPSLSPDGEYVAFWSEADNLDINRRDTNRASDIFINGVNTWRVTVNEKGEEANGGSTAPVVSTGGEYVAYQSNATNLDTSRQDKNEVPDIYVSSFFGGPTVARIVSINSRGQQANHVSVGPSISANGRFVAYSSFADNLDLKRPDKNKKYDIFVHDRDLDNDGIYDEPGFVETTRISLGPNGTEANGDSDGPVISADGSIVAFLSWATNLDPDLGRPDDNEDKDVFVHDRRTGETRRVSVNSDGKGADAGSGSVAISADGQYVVFASEAANLDLERPDNNKVGDVFYHDINSGETIRVSVNDDGQEGDSWSASPSVSADGRYVAFSSRATNLVNEDTKDLPNIYIRDVRPVSTEGRDLPLELEDGTNRLQAASDTYFTIDTGPATLDKYLFRDQGPIKFAITVDRVVGRTDAQGYLLNPDDLISKGIISSKITLLISAFDVDSNYAGAVSKPEINKVWVNGHYVGDLRGANDKWQVTALQVDVRNFKFGIPTCSEFDGTNAPAYLSVCSSAPKAVSNDVRIEIDTANNGQPWATGIDWAAFSFRAAPPILLVHGWNGSGQGEDSCAVADAGDGCEYWDKKDDKFYFGFRGLLNQAGFITANTENYLGGQSSFEENARRLAPIIQRFKTRYGVDTINIVAHSKGGLDSRAYLATVEPLDVGVLMTIASPHHGTYLADNLEAITIGLASYYSAAIRQLREGYVSGVFNPSHPARAGVRYYSIAADAGKTCRIGSQEWRCAENWQQRAWSSTVAGPLFQRLNNHGTFKGTNDFVVTVRSTQLLDIAGHDIYNTTEYLYSRNHFSVIGALKRKEEEDKTIVNLISSLLKVGTSGAIQLAGAVAEGDHETVQAANADTAVSTEAIDSSLSVESGAIGEGETFLQQVGIDSETEISFLLLWEQGELHLNLIDPAGTVFTPALDGESVYYEENRDGGSFGDPFLSGKIAAYSIIDPVGGTWQAQISADDQLPEDQANWSLIITQDSEITVSVAPDASWKALGDTVRLKSVVKAGSKPISGAAVEGQLLEPDGSLTTLPLYDDGAHDDGAAGDGIYGNSFPGSQFGLYSISAKATGMWNGVPFSRTAVSQVQVASGTASISGSFTDQGIDEDRDGLLDVIRVNVPIHVVSRGRFMASGSLRSGNDVLLSTANARGEFDPGQHVLALNFDAEQIVARGGSGRFSLSNLMLLDMSTADLPVRIAFSAKPYLTGNYGSTTLQHPSLHLTGVRTDYGVDSDGDGQFDELVMKLGVWLQSGGDLGWNGRLVDVEGHQIAVYSGGGNLDSGPQTITFHFSGKTIGEERRDGPYFLVDLEIWGNDGYFSAGSTGETTAYKYCQFASAGPCSGSECTVPVTGDWEVAGSCTLHTDRRAPGGVIVAEGVTLTIPERLVLDIDFANHNLRIKPGGKVLIKPGGKIQ